MSWIDKCDKEGKKLKQQREEAYRTQREMERAKAAVLAMEETRKREKEEEKARSRRAAAAAKHTKQMQNKHQRALENQLQMEKQAKEKERSEKLCRQARCDKQQRLRHKDAEAEAQERKMIRALGMVPTGANMTNEAKLELAKFKLKSLMATTCEDESSQEAGWTDEHWDAIIEQESEHVALALLSDSLVKPVPEKQILEAQALAKSIARNLAIGTSKTRQQEHDRKMEELIARETGTPVPVFVQKHDRARQAAFNAKVEAATFYPSSLVGASTQGDADINAGCHDGNV